MFLQPDRLASSRFEGTPREEATSLVAQTIKRLSTMWENKASVYNVGDLGSIPGLGSSLEKEMATHSSTLA